MSQPPFEHRVAHYRTLSGDDLRKLAKDPRTPDEDRDAIRAEFERRRAAREAGLSSSGQPLARRRAAGTIATSTAPASREVTVTDIDMPFASMVRFMVKWSLASIPAFIVLFAIFFIVGFMILRMLGAFSL